MIELDYEPLPVEDGLTEARAILARLYDLGLPEVGEGRCDDCSWIRELLKLGRVAICGDCAQRRQRAGVKVAA
jgi:hypothetical protein